MKKILYLSAILFCSIQAMESDTGTHFVSVLDKEGVEQKIPFSFSDSEIIEVKGNDECTCAEIWPGIWRLYEDTAHGVLDLTKLEEILAHGAGKFKYWPLANNEYVEPCIDGMRVAFEEGGYYHLCTPQFPRKNFMLRTNLRDSRAALAFLTNLFEPIQTDHRIINVAILKQAIEKELAQS